jgi:hypothetical protein
MENKQTAVEWLIEELGEYFPHEIGGIHLMVQKAKQMEKEQIIDAYEYGFWRGNNDDDFEPEEYYKNPYCNPNNKNYGK